MLVLYRGRCLDLIVTFGKPFPCVAMIVMAPSLASSLSRGRYSLTDRKSAASSRLTL